MPLRSVKMNRFIFGFHRRVWCPKCTPLSSSWRMVTTVPLLVTGLFLPRRAQIRRRGRKRPVTSNGTVVTMRQLLESGVHFGHQTRRWNPKMKRFIFTERNGIYIIDLQQTLTYIDRAYEFVKETVAHGGTVLFVGTKKQAQEAVEEQAKRVGMPYVNQRWLGGMLTNFSTVFKRLQRLKELEIIEQTGGATVMTKKEALVLAREREKLERTLGGIRHMSRTPSAIWIVDTKKEHIAVGEARKLGIPVVAILDTNCDPDEVDYKIPGNDDAIRSAALLTRVIADAVADGLIARAGAAANAGAADGADKPEPTGQLGEDEPLPEWERALYPGATAAAPVAAAPAARTPDPVPVPDAPSPESAVGEPAATAAILDDPVLTAVAAVAEGPLPAAEAAVPPQ